VSGFITFGTLAWSDDPSGGWKPAQGASLEFISLVLAPLLFLYWFRNKRRKKAGNNT